MRIGVCYNHNDSSLSRMIRLLKGTTELIDGSYIIIDVNGVGYYVFASHDVLSHAVPGAAIKVFIYSHIREDMFDLYGFAALEDLKLFEQVITVSGIGPKTAIGIFAIGSRDKIKHAIATGDVNFFTAVPRLGKKNAQKLIIELKNKIGSLEDLDLTSTSGQEDGEVIEALKTFGFTVREAQEAIRSLDTNASSTSDRVRLALKYLGK